MNVILTNYFTTKKDPQRGKPTKKDNYKLISPWLESVNRLKLNGIIFYDSLSDNFINKLSSDYVTFIPYQIKTNWSLNDERFLCWFEFLKENIKYKQIITTDLFDVKINKDPFKLVNDKKYKLYLGCNSNRKISNNMYICKKMKKIYKEVYHKDKTSVNAGVIGGNRKYIIQLFDRMINEFQKQNLKMNMNMAVYNKCVYDLYKVNEIFIGYPLTSRFKRYEENGSYYIKHK